VNIDIPYLDHPKWMNVGILPMWYKMYVEEQIKFMQDNHCGGRGFQSWETAKLERIQYLFNETPEKVHQNDFYMFFNEHDRRRGTSFEDTFPEMLAFYNACKNAV
jgi:hypothetical protein